jgi:hypothetical protein
MNLFANALVWVLVEVLYWLQFPVKYLWLAVVVVWPHISWFLQRAFCTAPFLVHEVRSRLLL